MFLCKWSVRRPIAMSSFIIVMVMLGINSYRKLSIDLMPSVDIPYVRIRAEYQGGSPEEIEVEVARRIEDVVASLDGLRHISTMCMENECRVNLEFYMGINVDVAATDVRENLNRIRDDFPEGVDEPQIRKIDNNAIVVAQLYLLGDRPIDAQCGHNAGMTGCLWDFYGIFKDATPDIYVTRLEDVKNYL